MRRAALIGVAVAVLAVLAVGRFVPWLTPQQDVALSFWRGKRESRLAALLGGIHKMAAFKPVGAWFFWALLVLVAVGVPAAVVAAFVLSAPGAEDRDVVEGVRQ